MFSRPARPVTGAVFLSQPRRGNPQDAGAGTPDFAKNKIFNILHFTKVNKSANFWSPKSGGSLTERSA
jgi:hypothetical protein